MTSQQPDNAARSLDEHLKNIFRSGVFTEFSRCRFYAEVDGEKIGVVLATKSAQFGNFVLNKRDTENLLEAKRSGRLNEAFIVKASARTYCSYHDAERFHAEVLVKLQAREGKFGLFYILPMDSEDEPF